MLFVLLAHHHSVLRLWLYECNHGRLYSGAGGLCDAFRRGTILTGLQLGFEQLWAARHHLQREPTPSSDAWWRTEFRPLRCVSALPKGPLNGLTVPSYTQE